MFFALTDEQRALEQTVRDYLADRFDTAKVREVYDDPAGDGIPDALWGAYGEQGMLAVLVPEEQDGREVGGLGLGLLDAAVVSRALGAGVAPGPWLPTVLAGEALRLGGSGVDAAGQWLSRIAAGEAKLAFAADLSLPVEYAAVADALVGLDPDVRITALGTARGLETKLVPERGYQLELITPVPLPRKPTGDLARLPARVLRAVRQTRAVLDKVDADVVIGFGGYVSLPAYLAARGVTRRRRRVPAWSRPVIVSSSGHTLTSGRRPSRPLGRKRRTRSTIT